MLPAACHITLYTSNRVFWEEKGTWWQDRGSLFSSSWHWAFYSNKNMFFYFPPPLLSLSLSCFCCSSATISLFCAFPWQYQTFPLPPPPSSCLFSHVTLASVLLTLPCKKSPPIFLQIFLSVLCPCLSFSRFYFSCKLTSPAILLSSHLKPVAACHPITADHPDDVSVSHSSQMTMTQPGCSVTRDTLGSSNLRSHLFVPMHV